MKADLPEEVEITFTFKRTEHEKKDDYNAKAVYVLKTDRDDFEYKFPIEVQDVKDFPGEAADMVREMISGEFELNALERNQQYLEEEGEQAEGVGADPE